MHPAPARASDVNGVRRCWAPLGFWPYVMPRECLTITRAIAVGERKHIVFSDTGFGTNRTRSLVLDRLCFAVCTAVGFPGWDVSHVRAICEQISPPAKRKLHLRHRGDQELPERTACQTLPMKNFLPDKPGALASQWQSREVFAGQCLLKQLVGSSPSSSQPGKSHSSTTASSSCSGPAEGCKDCRISSQGVPGVPY